MKTIKQTRRECEETLSQQADHIRQLPSKTQPEIHELIIARRRLLASVIESEYVRHTPAGYLRARATGHMIQSVCTITCRYATWPGGCQRLVEVAWQWPDGHSLTWRLDFGGQWTRHAGCGRASDANLDWSPRLTLVTDAMDPCSECSTGSASWPGDSRDGGEAMVIGQLLLAEMHAIDTWESTPLAAAAN